MRVFWRCERIFFSIFHEFRLSRRFSDAVGDLGRRVLGSQPSPGGGEQGDGDEEEPWLTAKEVAAARLSCKDITAHIVRQVHGKDAIEGLITLQGAAAAISLFTCLRKVK